MCVYWMHGTWLCTPSRANEFIFGLPTRIFAMLTWSIMLMRVYFVSITYLLKVSFLVIKRSLHFLINEQRSHFILISTTANDGSKEATESRRLSMTNWYLVQFLSNICHIICDILYKTSIFSTSELISNRHWKCPNRRCCVYKHN